MKERTALTLKASLAIITIVVCFSFNSSSLDEDTLKSLNETIAQLDSLSGYAISLTGHTDNIGSDAYNNKLSESRAIAVRNYLISKNVDSTKIKIDFRGEQEPIVPNTPEENRAMNRRVEITVNGQKISDVPEKTTYAEPVKPEPDIQVSPQTTKPAEVKTAPVKTEIKKKRVRRRLVWTGWRTGFHWSTSGR